MKFEKYKNRTEPKIIRQILLKYKDFFYLKYDIFDARCEGTNFIFYKSSWLPRIPRRRLR